MGARVLSTHRELREWASAYDGLISESVLEPVCLMHVLTVPWHTAGQLRIHNRMAAWLFALDTAAESARAPEAVDALTQRCERVIQGADPEDALSRCLRNIQEELRTSPLWPKLGDRWSELLCATLAAVRTEWRTRAAMDAGAPPPTRDQYVANCDNAVVRIAYFTYWLAASDDSLLGPLDELMAALWEAQVAIRWANDFRSKQREDAESRALDSAVLDLGVTELRDLATAAAARCADRLAPLLAESVPEAIMLDRMTRSAVGFYRVSDYRPEGRS